MLAPSRLIIDSIDLETGVGFGDVLFLGRLDPRQRSGLDGHRVSLIPAEIVARTDIDDAYSDPGGVGQPAP